MKGARLSRGRYEEQPMGRGDTGEPTLSSTLLKLDLFVNGDGDLRFRDPVTDEDLLTYEQQTGGATSE